MIFNSSEAQEKCVRSYLPNPDCASLRIEFYPATYVEWLGGILPTCSLPGKVRVCDWLILEEPEHLNWIRPWNRFHKRASRVTGILMTNYYFYAKHTVPNMPFLSWLFDRYNRWLTRHHCDDIIRTSSVYPDFPNSQQFYVNGIHPSFLETPLANLNSNKIYFMGKIIWEKGFHELIDLLSSSKIHEMDIFGPDGDRDAIETYAKSKGIRFHYKGQAANPAIDLREYKIFINTSRSEAICTTTAEALGQGRFVIIPDNIANDWFFKFQNCLVYSSPQEFNHHLKYALGHSPVEDSDIKKLTWEAATDRLLQFYDQRIRT